MDTEDSYYMFKLKNHEFTFDVNVATLPCGLNGALYFVAMDADGGMAKYPGAATSTLFWILSRACVCQPSRHPARAVGWKFSVPSYLTC